MNINRNKAREAKKLLELFNDGKAKDKQKKNLMQLAKSLSIEAHNNKLKKKWNDIYEKIFCDLTIN